MRAGRPVLVCNDARARATGIRLGFWTRRVPLVHRQMRSPRSPWRARRSPLRRLIWAGSTSISRRSHGEHFSSTLLSVTTWAKPLPFEGVHGQSATFTASTSLTQTSSRARPYMTRVDWRLSRWYRPSDDVASPASGDIQSDEGYPNVE